MDFKEILEQYQSVNWQKFSQNDVCRALGKERLDVDDFAALLSSAAISFMEIMAQKARALTVSNFGKTIQLYTPMYLANYCQNTCVYCGFNQSNDIVRKKLSLDETAKEARIIASWGIRHILILTGDEPIITSVEYIAQCVEVLKEFFDSISIEVYALTENEYRQLAQAGVDSLIIYQETYDKILYDTLHPSGPKKDFQFRLAAPERAARQGLRQIGIGALLGLSDWRSDAYFTGLHASYLQKTFPDIEIGTSIPRIRPIIKEYNLNTVVNDADVAQIILAWRLFLPRLGITISTREKARFREDILPLGITRMSAGSRTDVGGYSGFQGAEQFEIADERSVGDIKKMLESKGYQPIMKDWMILK